MTINELIEVAHSDAKAKGEEIRTIENPFTGKTPPSQADYYPSY